MEPGILTLKSLLNRSARWNGHRPALSQEGETLTYADLNERCRRVAAVFRHAGLVKGDRVGFLARSSIELVAAYYAAHKLGLVTANLHSREAVRQHVAILERLSPRVLVYEAELAPVAADISAQVGGEMALLPLGPATDPSTLMGMARDASASEPEVVIGEMDPATVLLSSGTTGLPKALLHTQRDVLTSCHGLMSAWGGIRPEDVFLNAFSPSFAVWLGHPTAFLNHGAHVVVQPRWDPEVFIDLIERHRVTCTGLTASMWKTVLRLPLERHDLSSLRLAFWLGERMARPRIAEAMARITPHFGGLYGLAEFIGGTGFTMIGADELRRGKWTSIGVPMLNTDLRVVSPGGSPHEELAPDEVGEIILKGATLAQESLTDPGWRATRVRDGWLYTGDLAYRDVDGYVHLEGRADFMINTAGIKFGPDEVEAALEQHPLVAEAAVMGIADDERGQRVLALIVLKTPAGAGPPESEALDQWCCHQESLAAFKRPRAYRFVTHLPRTPTGKLDRAELRRAFGGENAESQDQSLSAATPRGGLDAATHDTT